MYLHFERSNQVAPLAQVPKSRQNNGCPPPPPTPRLGAYLKHTGEFTVRYVLQNRLLEGDGTISKIRKVQVLDVDECTYTGRHAEVYMYIRSVLAE